MPGKLILIRHGQSIWNVENLFTGWYDVDLSETGRAEAARAGRGRIRLSVDVHDGATLVTQFHGVFAASIR